MTEEITIDRAIGSPMTNRELPFYVSREIDESGLELRANADGTPLIVGYAAVFNRQSSVITEWGTKFIEKIKPGAFTKTLKENGDVRALFNHDKNFVLGRGKNGTLRLTQDNHGLFYEIDPPPTPWARGLVDQIGRGDFDGASFGFYPIRDAWGTTAGPDNKPIDERTLLEVQLVDVGPVTEGAYSAASSALRSLLRDKGIDLDDISSLAATARECRSILEEIRSIRQNLPAESTASVSAPGQPTHATTEAEPTEPTLSGHSAEVLARLYRLEETIEGDEKAHPRRLRSG